MFMLSAVTAGYFFLQQGLVAHEKLEAALAEAGVDADGLAEYLEQDSRARFYHNKLKTLEYFLNVMLPRYVSYAEPILNRNYSALDIAL